MKNIIIDSQFNKAIDKFVTMELEPHTMKKSKQNIDSVVWFKDGDVIVEIENKEHFIVDDKIWDTISSFFSLSKLEIESVMKHWIKEHYNLEVLTTKPFSEHYID